MGFKPFPVVDFSSIPPHHTSSSCRKFSPPNHHLNGHLRNQNWSYLPYIIRPYVRGISQQNMVHWSSFRWISWYKCINRHDITMTWYPKARFSAGDFRSPWLPGRGTSRFRDLGRTFFEPYKLLMLLMLLGYVNGSYKLTGFYKWAVLNTLLVDD